jgi:hypothetical protein
VLKRHLARPTRLAVELNVDGVVVVIASDAAGQTNMNL